MSRFVSHGANKYFKEGVPLGSKEWHIAFILIFNFFKVIYLGEDG